MFLKKNKLTRNNIFNISNQLEDVKNIKHTHTKFTHGRRMTIIVELRIIVMDEDHLLISLCRSVGVVFR